MNNINNNFNTISNENEIQISSLDILERLEVNGNTGTAGQYIGKGSTNQLEYKNIDLSTLEISDLGIELNQDIIDNGNGQVNSENRFALMIMDATLTNQLRHVLLGNFITNQFEERPGGLHLKDLLQITKSTGTAMKVEGNLTFRTCGGTVLIYSKTSSNEANPLILGSAGNKVQVKNSIDVFSDNVYSIGSATHKFVSVYATNFEGNATTCYTAESAVNLSGFFTADISSGTHNLGGTGEVAFDDAKFNRILPKNGGANKTIGLTGDKFTDAYITNVKTNHIVGYTQHGEYPIAVLIDTHLPSADNTQSIGDYNIRYLDIFATTTYTDNLNTIGSGTHITMDCPIIPNITNNENLGSPSKVFKNIYATNFTATTFTGALVGNADTATTAATTTNATNATNAKILGNDPELAGSVDCKNFGLLNLAGFECGGKNSSGAIVANMFIYDNEDCKGEFSCLETSGGTAKKEILRMDLKETGSFIFKNKANQVSMFKIDCKNHKSLWYDVSGTNPIVEINNATQTTSTHRTNGTKISDINHSVSTTNFYQSNGTDKNIVIDHSNNTTKFYDTINNVMLNINHGSQDIEVYDTADNVMLKIDTANQTIQFFNNAGTNIMKIKTGTPSATVSPINFTGLPAVDYLGSFNVGDLYRAGGYLKVKE